MGQTATSGMFTIDDQHAHFMGMVSDLCLAAEVGRLEVELVTHDGARARGVPTTLGAAGSDGRTTGAGRIRLGDLAVNLDDVVECRVMAADQR